MEGIIWILLICLYFLPFIIAAARKHPQVLPIGIVNALLGFTVVAWVICLAWAAWKFKESES